LIFNNTRNFMVTKFKYLITYRNAIAKKGHINLEEYFNECLNSNDETIEPSNMDNSFTKINNNPEEFEKYNNTIKKNIKLHLLNSNNTVKEYLKNNLTTIGHSQGAIYAYLYGNIGKEVITFNPAPFNSNDKPANTYDIRIKGDIVSKFSGMSVIGKTQNATKIVLDPTKNKKNVTIKYTNGDIKHKLVDISKHSCEQLGKDSGHENIFFGDPTLKSDSIDNNIDEKPVKPLEQESNDQIPNNERSIDQNSLTELDKAFFTELDNVTELPNQKIPGGNNKNIKKRRFYKKHF